MSQRCTGKHSDIVFIFTNKEEEYYYEWAKERLSQGRNFVVEAIDGKLYFAPSRFVGYKQNSLEKHEDNSDKSGTDTDRELKRFYKLIDVESALDDYFIETLAQYGKTKTSWKFWIPKDSNIEEILSSLNNTNTRAKDMNDYSNYISLLQKNYNLIFNGAPGTGKTYLAKQIAAHIIFDGNVPENFEEHPKFIEQCGFVQFHPSYDYTDFVEGLRPTRQNENGNIGFERKDGIFKVFCKKTYINNRDKDIAANSIEFTETYSGGDDFDSLYNSLLEDILHERITEMVSKTGIRYKLEVGSGGNIRISGNDKPAKSVNEKNTRILFDYLIREKIYEIPREWTARHYFNIIAQDPEGPDTIDYKNYEWVLKILLSRYKHIHGESFKDSSMGTPDKVFVSSEPIALNNIKNEDERITRAMEWLMKQSGSTVKSVRGKTEYILVIKQNTIYLRIPNGNENYVSPKGIIRYLKTGEYNKGHQTYEPSIGNFIKENCPLYRNDSSNVIPNKDCSCIEISETKGTLPYIFIIDEINRGEISKIFGELFFSVDPGYRGVKGKVQTQYQNLITEDDPFKDGFYIPENVYIIGTMNDIDRSVECMDFAMRRRFTFKEITAEESASNMELGTDATERMMSLNNAISEIDGFNSSFHIGAAYFKGVDDFAALWELKLAGLLKEYLRGMPDAEESLEALKKAYYLSNE